MADSQPSDLRSLSLVTAELGFGAIEERLALRCVLAFRGGDVFRERFEDEFASEQDRADTFREVATLLRETVQFLRGDCGVPHVRLLPYSHVVHILVLFMRKHGAPSGRVATLLRRWIWRGAVAGTRAKGTSVSDIRNQVTVAEVNDDPLLAARALLTLVPQYPDFVPELDKVHFRYAMAKISALGLLSVGPRRLDTGDPVEVTDLLASGSPLHTIVPDQPGPLGGTMANRALVSTGRGRPVRTQLLQCPADVAASHLVDEFGRKLLLDDEVRAFLEYRRVLVEDAIVRHVGNLAEWGARDGRAISDLVRTVA